MSFSKSNKPTTSTTVEKENTTSTGTTSTSSTKIDVKGLKEALKEKGIEFSQFARSEENWRKRALKDDYQELKTKIGWRYDEAITEEPESETKEKEA